MIKKIDLTKVLLFALLFVLSASMYAVGKEPAKHSRLELADPFVLLEGGVYYAYGTHSSDGIEVFSSDDLKTWTFRGLALNKANTKPQKNFWAPEILKKGDTYYMYFSGEEHLWVATAKSPLGHFVQANPKPLLEHGSIDGSPFVDDDGQVYFSFVYFNHGNEIRIAKMADDLLSLRLETMQTCCKVSQPWEMDVKFPNAKVNEGPCILKHKDLYYLTYSANDFRSQNYGVGVALSDHLLSGWQKVSYNPILQNAFGYKGTGHHTMFVDKHGKLWMMFHAHKSETEIHPRASYFVRINFKKQKDKPDKLVVDDKVVIPVCR